MDAAENNQTEIGEVTMSGRISDSEMKEILSSPVDQHCEHCFSGWCKSPKRINDAKHCEHFLLDESIEDEINGGCELAL